MTYPEHELDPETPEADAAEQATLADPSSDESEPPRSGSIEAPEWDSWEQRRVVQLEDEDR
ncbi:hypothetical protein [Actinoplanes sp. NPDC049599]|uniref:hypothetical protein n=1 Tax=Actinoplanes sp. NPDC049599 TaxID=3363903 RepID=UPI0037B4EF71